MLKNIPLLIVPFVLYNLVLAGAVVAGILVLPFAGLWLHARLKRRGN